MNQDNGYNPMEHIPDVVVMKVFDFLPTHCFLPISHVSSRFRSLYLERWQLLLTKTKKTTTTTILAAADDECFITDPMSIGNLFASPWRTSYSSSLQRNQKQQQNSPLNTSLLQYYVSNGYGKNNPKVLKKVMLNTICRGDIHGMHFMVTNKYCSLVDGDEDLCTMAGAAGQLEALMWLRGESFIHDKVCNNNDITEGCVGIICPWNPTEVHREAAENSHDHILEYVERNSEGHQIQTHYGVGLPW